MSALVHGVLARERAALVAFVRRRAGHIVDPEEVVQQAAVQALARADQLRDPAAARAWLFRIVRNALAEELRRAGLPVQPADDAVAEVDTEGGEGCHCALALANRLKPEYATILQRVVVEDTPVTAMAGELGVTPNNAMVRLHRARKALRVLLAEHCGTTSLRACLDCACEERGCRALD